MAQFFRTAERLGRSLGRIKTAMPKATLRSRFFSSVSSKNKEDFVPYNIHGRIDDAEIDNKAAYKVFFREIPDKTRETLKDSFFILPISIGQEVHENGRMLATLELLKKHFLGGIVLVDDVVQRHTREIIEPQKDKKVIYKECLDDGKKWLEKYNPFFQNPTMEAMRWEVLLNHKEFPKRKILVADMLQKDAECREAFDRNINEFIGRLFQRDSKIDYKLARDKCNEYLIEECAVMSLWPGLRVTHEVYPKDRNHAMRAANRLIISKLYGRELPHIGLRFKKIIPKNTPQNNSPPSLKCTT